MPQRGGRLCLDAAVDADGADDVLQYLSRAGPCGIVTGHCPLRGEVSSEKRMGESESLAGHDRAQLTSPHRLRSNRCWLKM